MSIDRLKSNSSLSRAFCPGILLLLGACAGTKDAPPLPIPVIDWTPVGPHALQGGTRLTPGSHLVPSSEGQPCLLIENQSGVEFDLAGAELRGAALGEDLDTLTGIGILVRNCRDVTIKGGSLGGWKTCILVEDSSGVVLEDLSFDGWYGMRLLSSSVAEDTADWLRPFENDEGQWQQQYGAAISLTRATQAIIRRCRGRHGQNGILFSGVEGARVYDNDFSFMSGWGLGLWRSSQNTITRNLFDFCVRGHSHGTYWRGQYSAGILFSESSCENVVAFNSATHGGAGVFLHGGHDLTRGLARDRGEIAKGCDNNVFWGNDLRHAVVNCFEENFCTGNLIVQSRLSGSHQYGIWGDYSSSLAVVGNEIHDTRGVGISIEQGQDCVVADNDLARNDLALKLSWEEDPKMMDGPLGEQRDTSSRDHWIGLNRFKSNDQDLLLRKSSGIVFANNDFEGDGEDLDLEQVSAALDETLNQATVRAWLQGTDGELPRGSLSETSLIPHDGRRPELLRRVLKMQTPTLLGSQVIIAEERGVEHGGLESIVMGSFGPWDFPSGEERPEQRRPGGLLADASFDCRWFSWSEAESDPRGRLEDWRALAETPLALATCLGLVSPYGNAVETVKGTATRTAVGLDHFGLIAHARVETQGGKHLLRVTSDDGVRVLVDGRPAYEDWTWHATRTGEVVLELSPGVHDLLLEYFQIDGTLALIVELEAML